MEIRRDILLVPEELYNELEAIYKPIFEKNPIEPDTKFLLFGRGRIDLTPFGGLFLQACLKKLNEA